MPLASTTTIQLGWGRTRRDRVVPTGVAAVGDAGAHAVAAARGDTVVSAPRSPRDRVAALARGTGLWNGSSSPIARRLRRWNRR
jgi:hypothetical protein